MTKLHLTLALSASAMALSGCAATIARLVPQAEFVGVAAVEGRNARHCAGQTQAGIPVNRRRTVTLEVAREVADVVSLPNMGEAAQRGVRRTREIANRECNITPLPEAPAEPVAPTP